MRCTVRRAAPKDAQAIDDSGRVVRGLVRLHEAERLDALGSE